MNTVEYFLTAAKELHKNLLESVEGLNNDHLHFRPLGRGNHIAFTLWHCVRTEDAVINYLLQKRRRCGTPKGGIKNSGWMPEHKEQG